MRRRKTTVKIDPARYLSRVLAMNPLERGDEIIAARNRYLGVRAPSARKAQATVDLRELRKAMATRIDSLRSTFWNLNLKALERELAALRLDQFPDLRQAANRLWTAVEHRRDLPRLAQHRHFDPEFFSAFKQVLVLPPRQAADVKERVLESAGQRASRLKRAQRMIRAIRRHTPELYELEKEWLDLLLAYRNKSARLARRETVAAGSSGCGLSLGWWILIVIMIKAILLALASSN